MYDMQQPGLIAEARHETGSNPGESARPHALPRAISSASRSAALGFALVLAMLAMAAAAKVVLYDTLDPDSFTHLRVADQISQQLSDRGTVTPIVDQLSFASKRDPWTPYSWLAELAMKSVWDAGGYRAAVATAAAVEALFVIFAGLAALEASRARAGTLNVRSAPRPAASATPAMVRGADPTQFAQRARSPIVHTPRIPEPPRFTAAAIAAAAAAFLSLAYLSFRPVTLALCGISLCSWLLQRDRRLAASGRRGVAVWAIVPITAILANVHLFALVVPAWVAALMAGAALESRRESGAGESVRATRRYMAMGIATALASFCTPLLPGMLRVLVHYQTADPMVAAGGIAELQPFYTGGMGQISAVIVVAIAACVVANFRRLRSGDLIWLLLAGLMMFHMGRMAPLFALAAAPIIAVAAPLASDRAIGRPSIVCAVLLLLVLGGARLAAQFPPPTESLDNWLARLGPDSPAYPCAAAGYVDAQVPPATGKIINEWSWGGYLEWRLGPKFKVMSDGRTQLFDDAFWQAGYLQGERQRRELLSQITADAAVLPAARSRFHDTLASLGWHTVYHDADAEVMIPPDAGATPASELRVDSRE
jgi:hypothetical protein